MVTVVMLTSPGLVVHVSLGNPSVLIVTGGSLKTSPNPKMTRTCVVTRIAVPQMDRGVIPQTQTSDGNIATYLVVLQEVKSTTEKEK